MKIPIRIERLDNGTIEAILALPSLSVTCTTDDELQDEMREALESLFAMVRESGECFDVE